MKDKSSGDDYGDGDGDGDDSAPHALRGTKPTSIAAPATLRAIWIKVEAIVSSPFHASYSLTEG
jgi:hypothetical protein